MSTQEAIARAIAEKAHAGQVDRCGAPYIDHPAHVASRVQGDAAKAVAWLHDVVEDTDVTLDDLREAGLSEEVVAGVAAMTHHEDEPYLDYVRRAKADPLARQVKLQDLLHKIPFPKKEIRRNWAAFCPDGWRPCWKSRKEKLR